MLKTNYRMLITGTPLQVRPAGPPLPGVCLCRSAVRQRGAALTRPSASPTHCSHRCQDGLRELPALLPCPA